eukprot:CAMPEP_0176361410 /NCGR_PEP_ID=MMETSP0126-20121128/17732_1 /TAXON_ID=141414 ORGANISM="Strombidinopsis acuminatum, Strain SPMC142" /NCGR_SAMPLE_ID=MMETSP0126 /ASSEMBLY_ACC=CAM_ASM_000229 /LENGTH=65 /DNA_ID=CAMNT_0017716963 /DNA_START=2413 /DNA_END=2610 /DNA_ORIENTATION=-
MPNSKGSKELNSFRAGPVRATLNMFDSSSQRGATNSNNNQSKNSLIGSGVHGHGQPKRPSSSKVN